MNLRSVPRMDDNVVLIVQIETIMSETLQFVIENLASARAVVVEDLQDTIDDLLATKTCITELARMDFLAS